MFWTEEKLALRLNELEGYRYREGIALDEWAAREDNGKENGVYPPQEFEGEYKLVRQDRWKGRDKYLWLNRKVQIPAAWSGQRIVGVFDFGKTGAGNNGGFESLLYVNGQPYQGVDSNHKEVFFPDEYAGQVVDLTFRLWSGLDPGARFVEQEHEFKRAELAVLDAAADDLYYTARAALSTSRQLPEGQPDKQELLMAVDRAFLQLDWSRPGSPFFYESVTAAAAILREAVSRFEKKHAVTVTCIGHTHIDVAWMWRLTHTREKAARSFSTVLRLMEQYPDYVFLQSQPQLYAYIKQDYPEIYAQIKERVKEGRWEVGGAMWLEADCNLTSGESLVRQILYGTQFFREEFGVECKYLWLPDVFGYSWALPQILRKSGIDTFMTTKISWNQYNRLPHDTFHWRGIDGSEVLTHFITTPEKAEDGVWWYTYNGLIEPFAVKGIWDQYRDKNVNRDLLLSYGYGDGGGGVNREMLEMRRRLDEMPGIPHVQTGRAQEYFERLQETFANTDQYVHTWDGELYLEYHRGTYTSQAHNKRMNRKLELLYREAEWLQTLLAVEKGGFTHYPAARFKEGWTTILRNQFHDIIPGSSIREVYEDSRVEYAEAESLGQALWTDAAAELAVLCGSQEELGASAVGDGGEAVTWTVFNGTSCTRTELVVIPARADGSDGPVSGASHGNGRWTDAAGNVLQAERGADGQWLVQVQDIPALGSEVIQYRPAHAALPASHGIPFSFDSSSLTTPFYLLEWNEAGQLTRLYDRSAQREVLFAGERGNVLQVFEDKPKMFNAWDIDLFYQEKMREIKALQSIELVESNMLQAVVRFVWTYMDSVITQDMKVYAHSRRIDYETHVDWHEQQQLLKVAFPVAVRATEATYDIQFGNVKRPTHWNTSWDYARFETVGHQWADLSERGYGVSLLNDCKYGYDVKDHVLRLSLIKSAINPDETADQGEHRFTYSLLPHEGDWVQGQTVQEAWFLNNRLRAVKGAYSAGAGKSLIRMDRDNIAVDAVKMAEDGSGWIIRLHEYTGVRSPITLVSDYPVASWQECDLLERPVDEAVQSSGITLQVNPYEIKTLLVKTIEPANA
ncbi:MAG: alpha-mannosidase [Paenibacillaceae bacterium]|nr:alpha-mannosidase [Paenibacillaceae bacterium]